METKTNNMVQEDKKEKPQKKDAGSILKNERESQGLSINMVSEETKIPMDALRAIEEGYSIRTMTSFYYKGFVKMYAKYLNIDPRQVIDEPKKKIIPQHEKIEIEENPLVAWLSTVLTRRRKQQIVIGVGILIGVVLVLSGLMFIIRKATNPKSGTPTKKETTQQTEGAKITQAKPATVPPVRQDPVKVTDQTSTQAQAGSTPETGAMFLSKNVTLTVRAKEDNWLRVKVDGNIVFQSTLRLGTVETWLADEKIEISGKNISQLQFELNGKMIGSLGRRGRTIKQIEVTKDGFNVIK